MIVKFKYLLLLIYIAVVASCANNDSQQYDNQIITNNKFSDLELQNIYNFQNERNTKSLLAYLNNEKAQYRDAAAIAFASVQDSTAIEPLLNLLKNDNSVKVCISSAFAIGQIGAETAQKELIKVYESEKIDTVKLYIAEAIGKCGNTMGLEFLTKEMDKKQISQAEQKAIFMGISNFFMRRVFSHNTLEKLLKYIDDKDIDDNNLYVASIALSRFGKNEIEDYDKKLIEIFNNTQNLFTKLNIINALAKNSSKTTLNFIRNMVNSSCDYRLKVNSINTFSNQEYNDIKDLLISLLHSENPNVSIRASEFIISNGKSDELDTYLLESEKISEWRTRTNLLAAALKYSNDKTKISKIIKTHFDSASNEYEKASLLASLGYDINNYKFVSSIVHQTNNYVIGTYGMEAISQMCKNDDFETINEKRISEGKKDLKSEFAYILKDAIMSKDVSRTSIAAGIIRNSKLNFVKEYENTYFLTQALNNCELPKDLEAYIELRKTIAVIKGNEIDNKNNSFAKASVDWDYIAKIPYNQQVMIKTNKGNIIIELSVNNTPVSVANFLQLINNKYFNNKNIHRVVPNFVVQDGCPRGDGWGTPNYTIYPEFPVNYYTEGSLGMASAGKDTESSQWFITHSPTPNLNGKYTNFGTVIKGMDIVHKLTVGDKIVEITILNTPLN